MSLFESWGLDEGWFIIGIIVVLLLLILMYLVLYKKYRKLQENIEGQIADVSLAVAQKVLARQITPEDDKRLIEESLAQWSKE